MNTLLTNKTEPIIELIKPIIIYPTCLKSGRKQDCFNCKIFKAKLCKSPRGMCARSYPGHPKGCPQYGKKLGCPPNLPMFDEIYDMNKPIYAIVTMFDLGKHIEKMKLRHPNWTERQLKNPLYWQGTDKKEHKKVIAMFNKEYRDKGYVVTTWPEGLGMDMTNTLKQIGIELEWPVKNYVYRTSIAGILKEDNCLDKYGISEIKGLYGEYVLRFYIDCENKVKVKK